MTLYVHLEQPANPRLFFRTGASNGEAARVERKRNWDDGFTWCAYMLDAGGCPLPGQEAGPTIRGPRPSPLRAHLLRPPHLPTPRRRGRHLGGRQDDTAVARPRLLVGQPLASQIQHDEAGRYLPAQGPRGLGHPCVSPNESCHYASLGVADPTTRCGFVDTTD